jgi:transcriptional regulator with XRE-family HTH domain
MSAPPKRSSSTDDDALKLPRTLHERSYMSELGQRLRSLREERGMTQHALARAAGIATDMVSRLENGHYTSPGLRTLVRLADGMGVGVAALLPELAGAASARDPDAAARARLQALLARASTGDVELIAELAAAVLAHRHH